MPLLSVRLLSGLLAISMYLFPLGFLRKPSDSIGNDSDGIKTVYVSCTSVKNPNGTPDKPYGSIDEAKNAIRKVNKSLYKGINVLIESGTYQTDDSIIFENKDSGTPQCPVSYIGEENTILSGSVIFSRDDFSVAEGETCDRFWDEVTGNIVMLDLKQYGFSPDDLENMSMLRENGNNVFLYSSGEKQTLARYPNEGFAYVRSGSMINSAKGWEWAELGVDTMFLNFDRDHLSTVKTWSNFSTIYTVARYNSITYADDPRIVDINKPKCYQEVYYTKRVEPKEGMPFYWYNIPEELDLSGEYYIDKNCILYYYPKDNSDNSVFSLSKLDKDFIVLNNADNISFSNIEFSGTRQNCIVGQGNNITVDKCTISEISQDGISIEGTNNTVSNCKFSLIGESAVILTGGDDIHLIKSENTVYNNDISNWAQGTGINSPGIKVSGCGATVSHNECLHSNDTAIYYEGPYNTIEYNYCSDTSRFVGECGVIGSIDFFTSGTVIRYNYIKDNGYTRDTNIDSVGVQGIMLGGGQQGVKVYGNIVENITGNGIALFGGRDNEVYGNLIIKSKYAIHYDGCFMIQAYNCDPIGCNRVNKSDDHIRSAEWQKAFPVINDYTYYNFGMDYDKECLGDKNFNAAPVSKIYSNVCYIDKVVCERSDQPFYSDKYVKEYSGSDIEYPSAEDGTLKYYTSKRIEYTAADIIEQHESKLQITTEQFDNIGLE